MMKAFLENIADEIIARSGDDPGRICVVLPNRRAGLFLKRYLSDRYKKTFWPPEVYSIEDFVIKYSGNSLCDQATLIFELYRVHTDLNKVDPQDFETFAGWGQMLLADFNEIDLYMADPHKIFRDISDTRALSVWNLGECPLTAFEQNYIRFYQGLLDYYLGLKERLLAQKLIYKGLAYRMVAENIESISRSFTWDRIFIAGLNALSTSEEVIINYLVEKNMADIFWDADRYYIGDNFQEAGHFIREHLKHSNQDQVKWIGDHFKSKKNITVTGISGLNGQATYAGHLLRQMGLKPGDLHRTAVIMADEKLLLPMINSLPEEIATFNITMGFPMRLTPVYQFFRTIFRLHIHSDQIRARKGGKGSLFYARDVLNVLSSPYMAAFGEKPEEIFGRVSRRFRESGKVIYSASELLANLSGLPGNVMASCTRMFNQWESPRQAIAGLQSLLEDFRQVLSDQENKYLLELEHFYHFARILRRVSDLLASNEFVTSLRSLEKVMLQILDSYTLPFYGEPLNGVQLMGVLETRAIDFDNIIILSVNEGVLPSGRMQQSFIPFEIKRDHKLPTHREKDAIFSYHFYRILQRAENVHLVYETEGSRLGGGEKSRFITQLQYELPKYNNQEITEKVFSFPLPSAAGAETISFALDDSSWKRLVAKARTGLSPSALNTYIQCSLRFYFQEILGLSETEEVEEVIETGTLGEVIHHALHRLLSGFEGKPVSSDDIRQLIPLSDKVVESAYKEKYTDGDINQGKNLLIFEVSKLIVHKYLKQHVKQIVLLESKGIKLHILHLEKFFNTELNITAGVDVLPVKLKGKADRIDQEGDIIRIIDYKTGIVRATELKISDWDELTASAKYGKAFQLLLYAYLYHKDQQVDPARIVSGNVTLKKTSQGFMKVQLPGDGPMGMDSVSKLEELIINLLEEIFDPATVFSQTEDENNCKYCPFKAFCNR